MGWRLSLLIFALLLLVGCDHATKAWAEGSLAEAPLGLVPGVLELDYTRNYDVAFSLLRWVPVEARYVVIVTMNSAMTLYVLGLWWVRRRAASLVELASYALIIAGALGNLLDRIVRGYVVDFVDLHFWPVFNVADALLVVGLLALLIQTLRRGGGVDAPAPGPTPS